MGNRFPKACVLSILGPDHGNRNRSGALTGDDDQSRGRAPRKRGAEDMIEPASNADPRKVSAVLDEARLRQQAIGARLRQMFDEVVNEPVPDEFLDILRKADKRTSENG